MRTREIGGVSFYIPSESHWNLSHSRRQGVHSTPEDLLARFYEDYRKVAEDYDREFMKKCDEDLNTTLIFVRPAHRSDMCVVPT